MSVTLLNVDHNDAARYAKSRLLRLAGYQVMEARTGAEALRLTQELRPPLVLLDVLLPDMDGTEVLRRIREKHPAIDVIMLTGHGSIDTAIEAIRAGAFDYIAKPCPLGELEVPL